MSLERAKRFMAVLVMRRQRVDSAGWEAALLMVSVIESAEH